MVQPAADRSADASESSKACSTVRSSIPSISRMRPEKIFFLPFFSTVDPLISKALCKSHTIPCRVRAQSLKIFHKISLL